MGALSLDQKMKLFGLVLISLTAAASPYHYRQPRDLANAANGGFGAGPGSNNKLSLTEGFEGKGAKKAKKEGKKDKKASKKAAKESGDSDAKKKKTKKKKIDCEDEAVLAKYIEELLQPNETHDDISNYVKCKKPNKKKEQKEHKKLKQQDNKKYNEQFYGLISQESSRSEAE